MSLKIIYRGSLNSCNYHCSYCPFAKSRADSTRLQQDREELERFSDWVSAQRIPLRLLFTPWGEALIWPWYQQALSRLSSQPHVHSVAIQTNLSGPQQWLQQAEAGRITLWASFHPEEVSLDSFLRRCDQVLEAGARLSVGMVGLKEYFHLARRLSQRLPDTVSFWINAYKDRHDYYSTAEIDFLSALDPFFVYNLQDHQSAGKACFSGETVFTVDGAGEMRRCHFIDRPIGNLYRQDYRQALKPRPCSNRECGCYLGYIHLQELDFRRRFGPGYFERYRPARKAPAVCIENEDFDN